MPLTMTVFSELTANYQTWDALRLFLTSESGGKLRVMTSETDDLAIIRYTKGVSDFKKSHVPYFRSVVWSKSLNQAVCVAPIKAVFGNAEPGVTVRVTDFVDGTMINAFRTDQGVRIATRTSLDARGTFYSTRSFAELFSDAWVARRSSLSQFFRLETLPPLSSSTLSTRRFSLSHSPVSSLPTLVTAEIAR